MAYEQLPTRDTDDANAFTDVNQLQENINQMIDGTGTSMSSHTMAQLSPTSQAGAPSSTPSIIGEYNLDTTATRWYMSTGTSSSADWDRLPYVDYGVVTVTSGGGDITVNLPQSWEGGILIIFKTDTSTEYMSDSGSAAVVITTYDALTDEEATYSSDHSMLLSITPSIVVQDKSVTGGGLPKSATAKSFTLDDDGTRYVKWMVIS